MTKKGYHHGHLAEALVAAALAALESGGVAALSLRDLAKRLEVSPSAVYRHYADKEALLAEVAAEGFATLTTAFDRAAAGRADPVEHLKALGEAYLSFALGRPNLYRLMFGTGHADRPKPPRLAEESGKAYAALGQAVAACRGAGGTPREETTAAVAAWSLVHGYAMLRLDGQLAKLPPEALPEASEVLGRLLV